MRYGLKSVFYGIDEVPLYVFVPYPGSEITEQLVNTSKIKYNDEYFFKCSSLNSSYLSTNVTSFNDNINSKTLGIIRLLSLFTNYGISYTVRPHRIFRTLRNILLSKKTSTVFEQRIKDLMQRNKNKKELQNIYN